MAESLKPEWKVLTTEDGRLLYHNDKTGEETYESPYQAQLNKFKNCDLTIWKDRREECVRFADVHPRPRVNLDLNFGERVGGRITIELFADVAPLAAYNFYCLCSNEFSSIRGHDLKLKGSFFHSCIPGIGMLGGDITDGDGTGGMSIYGAPYEDENINKPLDRGGLLISLSEGPHLNLSRFAITSSPTPSLFGTASLFGKVIRGLAVIRMAMSLATTTQGNTNEIVSIANTSIAEDGPRPVDFTVPKQPSVRPNPFVPPSCDSLLGTNSTVGGAHLHTQQRESTLNDIHIGNQGYDQNEIEPAPPGAEEGETIVNETPANPSNGYDYYGYVTTVHTEEGETNWDQDDRNPANFGQDRQPKTSGIVPEYETGGSFISPMMDDYRRGTMPKDGEGRHLAHYLDLSSLDQRGINKQKQSKIPHGFKTWKEYGEFKKKEKRTRQVKDILEDKYPVEYLEKRRHK